MCFDQLRCPSAMKLRYVRDFRPRTITKPFDDFSTRIFASGWLWSVGRQGGDRDYAFSAVPVAIGIVERSAGILADALRRVTVGFSLFHFLACWLIVRVFVFETHARSVSLIG